MLEEIYGGSNHIEGERTRMEERGLYRGKGGGGKLIYSSDLRKLMVSQPFHPLSQYLAAIEHLYDALNLIFASNLYSRLPGKTFWESKSAPKLQS